MVGRLVGQRGGLFGRLQAVIMVGLGLGKVGLVGGLGVWFAGSDLQSNIMIQVAKLWSVRQSPTSDSSTD